MAIGAPILPFPQNFTPFRHGIFSVSRFTTSHRRVVFDSLAFKILLIIFSSGCSHHHQVEHAVVPSLLIEHFFVRRPESSE
jgi:hypothetical protein